ncbi:MAG: preprotein translocase subunit SecG [Gemmatimonadota bacterium]
MFGILLTLLILDGILLMVIVLMQAGKGGGLAAMGGGGGTATESFMGGRQAATVLTKSTWITAAIFLVLALVLSILSSRSAEDTPLLQEEFQTAPVAPQPVVPGTGETGEGAGEAAPGGVVPGVGETPGGGPDGGEESGGQ